MRYWWMDPNNWSDRVLVGFLLTVVIVTFSLAPDEPPKPADPVVQVNTGN